MGAVVFKFSSALLVILVVASALASGQTRYRGQSFSLTVPSGWSVVTDEAVLQQKRALLVMSHGGLEIQVVVAARPSLEEIVATFDGAIESLGPKTMEKTLTIHEVPCHMWVREKGGEAVLSAALLSGRQGFLVVGIATRGSGPTVAEEYIEVLKSFRVDSLSRPTTHPSGSGTPKPASTPDQDDF